MNCLSYTAPIFRTTGRFVASTSSLFIPRIIKPNLSAGIKLINVELALTRVHAQLYSTRRRKTTTCRSRANAVPEPPLPVVEVAFYVVRKGDIVGVYKSFGDCAAQIGSDLKQDQFGELVLCPFHEPALPAPSKCEEEPVEDTSIKSSDEVPVSENVLQDTCSLEFDGASKGNPGLAGAGAVLRANDGSLICKVHEGLGIKTNNVAEYRALILGLKYALKKGFTKIRVQGDSKLVCMQVQGLWKVKNQNLSDLFEEVKELKEKFVSFEISHVLREKNSEVDAQTNLAVHLTDGEVHEII